VAKIANVNIRTVQRARRNTIENKEQTFTSLQRKPGEKRESVLDLEKDAILGYMREKCPPRSGDKQEILWMTSTEDDFYYDDYRSRDGQLRILKRAVNKCPDISNLREKQRNQFERNIVKYLDARDNNKLSELCVHKLKIQDVICAKKLAIAAVTEESDEDEQGDDGEDDGDKDVKDELLTLYPRSKRSFYKSLKKEHLLWNRPPDNHCTRCADFSRIKAQIGSLQGALSNTGGPGFTEAAKVVADAGGEGPAYELLRELNTQMPELRKHMMWKEHTRSYLKEEREKKMKPHEMLLQLDYGGFSDSNNDKVSCWSVTAVGPQVEKKSNDPEYFDFFFDASNQQGGKDKQGAKKSGHTGKFFLQELLESKDGKPSLFQERFPAAEHLLLSGDTGNGYRAYEMLEELSILFHNYGYSTELVPLTPAHAFNRTDSHIAHMNKLIKKIKRKGRVFGAKGFTKIFRHAADPNVVGKAKLMKRNNAFFRVVPPPTEEDKEKKKGLGVMLHDDRLAQGKIGVRGLLYFDFSMPSEHRDGPRTHPQGYALVRVHPDPNLPNNPTMVWSWRKDLQKLMCQYCSNQAGRVVPLSVAGCTKKVCAIKAKQTHEAEQACARSQLPAGHFTEEHSANNVDQSSMGRGRRRQAGLICTACANLRTAHGCTGASCKVCTTCTQREGKPVLKNVLGCRKNACKYDKDMMSGESETEEEEDEDDELDDNENGEEEEECEEEGENGETEKEMMDVQEESIDELSKGEKEIVSDRNWADHNDDDGYVQINSWDAPAANSPERNIRGRASRKEQRESEKNTEKKKQRKQHNKRPRDKGEGHGRNVKAKTSPKEQKESKMKTVKKKASILVEKKNSKSKRRGGKKDDDVNDDDWEISEGMTVYVWDLEEGETKKVYKVSIVRMAEENILKQDRNETCWDVEFKTNETCYYPESRLFRTRPDAEKDMEAS
jgi:hypothetical protein